MAQTTLSYLIFLVLNNMCKLPKYVDVFYFPQTMYKDSPRCERKKKKGNP